MSKHQDYVQKTEALVEPILQKHQFELVDVEFVKEAGSWHLRVYIDKEGGITIDDLTLVNHELSDEMDKDDFLTAFLTLLPYHSGIRQRRYLFYGICA